jgi:hypothetical protein
MPWEVPAVQPGAGSGAEVVTYAEEAGSLPGGRRDCVEGFVFRYDEHAKPSAAAARGRIVRFWDL